MKRNISVLLRFAFVATVCLFCLLSCKNAQGVREYRSGAYKYTVENEEVTITQHLGLAAHVTIPESIKGMPVVAIHSQAFSDSPILRSVTIPDSVVRIGNLAFFDCYALEHVTLGCGIREIGFSAFSYCNKMTYNVYKNGNYIGNDENPYLALVSVSSRDIQTLTIHPDTVVICGSSIEGCYLLREIEIPDSVVSIGSYAFQYCSSLEKVYIPESVEHIDFSPFMNCSMIREIAVSDENPHFKSVGGSLLSRDGTRLIKYAAGQNVSSYRIPDGTLIVEDYAFENAKHLTEVVLSDSVEELAHSSFIYCENLHSIQLGNSLKTIGGAAFGFCSSLTEITIPDSVTELSYSVFSECNKLESVVIGKGVISLETETFYNCNALKSVVFRDPNGWKVRKMWSLSSEKIDLSDPKRNADYLADEYCVFYWKKE